MAEYEVHLRILALFISCERHQMSVPFHIGHTNGEYGWIDEPGLPQLEMVLKIFPKLKSLG